MSNTETDTSTFLVTATGEIWEVATSEVEDYRDVGICWVYESGSRQKAEDAAWEVKRSIEREKIHWEINRSKVEFGRIPCAEELKSDLLTEAEVQEIIDRWTKK